MHKLLLLSAQIPRTKIIRVFRRKNNGSVAKVILNDIPPINYNAPIIS